MKKLKGLFLLIFIGTSCLGQENKSAAFTIENFNSKILEYEPVKRKEVPEKKFNHGIMILNDVKSSVGNDPTKLNDADFWNITMAFQALGESNRIISIAFEKATEYKNNNICSYLNNFGPSGLDKSIPDLFFKFYNSCKNQPEKESKLDIREYSRTNNLNYELVKLIQDISANDKKIRKEKGNFYEDKSKVRRTKTT